MRVLVNKIAFRRFKQLARANYPNEYFEVLVGRRTADEIIVFDFWDIKQKASKTSVTPDVIELKECRKLAAEHGMEVIGSIHSHPDCEPHPSECDNNTAREWRELIFSIYQVKRVRGRFRTRVEWWPTQNPITKKVEFA